MRTLYSPRRNCKRTFFQQHILLPTSPSSSFPLSVPFEGNSGECDSFYSCQLEMYSCGYRFHFQHGPSPHHFGCPVALEWKRTGHSGLKVQIEGPTLSGLIPRSVFFLLLLLPISHTTIVMLALARGHLSTQGVQFKRTTTNQTPFRIKSTTAISSASQ